MKGFLVVKQNIPSEIFELVSEKIMIEMKMLFVD